MAAQTATWCHGCKRFYLSPPSHRRQWVWACCCCCFLVSEPRYRFYERSKEEEKKPRQLSRSEQIRTSVKVASTRRTRACGSVPARRLRRLTGEEEFSILPTPRRIIISDSRKETGRWSGFSFPSRLVGAQPLAYSAFSFVCVCVFIYRFPQEQGMTANSHTEWKKTNSRCRRRPRLYERGRRVDACRRMPTPASALTTRAHPSVGRDGRYL